MVLDTSKPLLFSSIIQAIVQEKNHPPGSNTDPNEFDTCLGCLVRWLDS